MTTFSLKLGKIQKFESRSWNFWWRLRLGLKVLTGPRFPRLRSRLHHW